MEKSSWLALGYADKDLFSTQSKPGKPGFLWSDSESGPRVLMVLPWFCHGFGMFRHGFAMFCHGFAMFCHGFAMFCHGLPWFCHGFAMFCHVFDLPKWHHQWESGTDDSTNDLQDLLSNERLVLEACRRDALEITNELWPRPPTMLRGKLIDEGWYIQIMNAAKTCKDTWTIINIIWNILIIHIDVLKSFTKLHNKPTINQQTSGTRQRFGGAIDRRKIRVRSWWIGSPICCQSCLENLDMRAGAVEAKIQ